MEKIIETKTCRCGKHFDITDKDLEFYDRISPVFVGIKFSIPTPALCPDCRLQRRLSFRNERKLYKRNCDASDNEIISIYSPDKPYKVFGTKVWLSDSWNPKSYGAEFEFGLSFFEQFGGLMQRVPLQSIINDNGNGSENSAYTMDFASGKNCYYCFETGSIEDSLYSHHCNGGKYIVDSDEVLGNSQYCYECVACLDLYNCQYLFRSKASRNCYFSVGLTGCSECFGCSELENKKYCFNNQELSKEAYDAKVKIAIKDSEIWNAELQRYLKSCEIESSKRPEYQIGSEGCRGNGIFNSKNVTGSYMVNSSNSKYCINSDTIVDCYDLQCWKSELSYEGVTPDNGYKVCFSVWNWESRDCYYNMECYSCNDIFGCIGLSNAEYCILNKQYTKEEYESLVPKIIEHMKKAGEWGEFFPSSISPFGYNETVANEYFPLSKDDSLKSGFKWSDYDPPFPKVEKIIPASKIPFDVSDIPDDILNWAIECETSKKPYRVIRQELDFYRIHNLSVPRKHPDMRHLDRIYIRNSGYSGYKI